jgi:CubicO group peptidase (beta-lactamase class C family)
MSWRIACVLGLIAAGCDDGSTQAPPIELPDAAADAGVLDQAIEPDAAPIDAAVDMMPPDQSMAQARVEQIEALYQPWVDAAFFPSVSIALVTADDVRFLELGDGITHGPDTLYEIGSISKVFTGLLLAEMVAAEQVTLDTPIGDLLPIELGLSDATAGITLEALTTHRSGLPRLADNMPFGDPTDPYADYTVDGMYTFLQGFDPPAQPSFGYSNLGVGLLGHVLGRAAGEDSWEAALTTRILAPLGMQATAIQPVDPERLIEGHDADGRPVPPWIFTDASAAAGALRSSIRDLAVFAQAQLNAPDVLNAAILTSQQPLAQIAPDVRIGHGWFLVDMFDALYHDGGTGGFVSFLAVDPMQQRAVIALHNGSSAASNALGWAAFQLWTGQDVELPTPPEEVELTVEQLDALAGTYAAPGAELVIRREGERLFVRLGAQPEFGIYPLSTVEFYLRVVEARLWFTVIVDTVTAVTLLQDGRETRFDRQN